MTMTLKNLLSPWLAEAFPDCTINALYNDSRQVQAGGLFLAYPGAATDGRMYMKQAADAGAAAIVYEKNNWPEGVSLPSECLCLPIEDIAGKLAAIASRYYDNPGTKVSVTGITGTNGKTSIAWQLTQAHDMLSTPAAYIGTLGFGTMESMQASLNTTPDALCLQTLLYQYVQCGIRQINMEVSSHALDQGRVDCIDFKQAIFTNLTLDHLDYHHTMEAYAAAKATLFKRKQLQWAIINQDDPYASLMKEAILPGSRLMTYGMSEGCDVRVAHWEVGMKGTVMDVESPWGKHQISIGSLGYFNIYNSIAVFTSLMLSGYDVKDVIPVMSRLKSAPGRMDLVAHEPCVLVDYAHTPDALENVLQTLNKVKKGRLIVVFGCGGDRDKSKRPVMGEIASRCADIAIITSDNPRSENPWQIALEIEKGVLPGNRDVYRILDREQAIARAISMAAKEDIVLVAGKGHETYQQIGDVRHPFSDHEVITRLMKVSPIQSHDETDAGLAG